MPRMTFPPTPASSTDIVGKDSANQLLSKEKTSFALPPPAIAPAPSRNRLLEEERPQDGPTVSDFSLPPPPTRSRKIIQMTPKMRQIPEKVDLPTEATPARARQLGARGAPTARKTTTKKPPNTTSQAGKRIARKTAHSVIERRRRSKMNEEFGVLKNMIPACKDQDMHKLAILQVCDPRLSSFLSSFSGRSQEASSLRDLAGKHRIPSISRAVCHRLESCYKLANFTLDYPAVHNF